MRLFIRQNDYVTEYAVRWQRVSIFLSMQKYVSKFVGLKL